jgi:hypothetical protein
MRRNRLNLNKNLVPGNKLLTKEQFNQAHKNIKSKGRKFTSCGTKNE